MSYEDFKTIVLSKKNVFLTGQAGSGKSTNLSRLMIEERQLHIDITSTTGVSAVNIGGRTIHSFSGIGVINNGHSIEEIVKKVKKIKNKKEGGNAVKNILECSILVIDEISMLSLFYFETLDQVFKIIRKNEKPFGGIQVIFTGDMLQLPPIDGEFCFKSKIWKSLNLQIVYLQTLYRFTDVGYSEMLGRIRTASHTPEDNVELFKRFLAYKNTDLDALKIQPTFLYSKKIDVFEKNYTELEKNSNPMIEITAIDSIPLGLNKIEENTLNLMAPKILHLKIGAQVMLTVNTDVESGLCNGSRGVVLEYEEKQNILKIEFSGGRHESFCMHSFEHKENDKVISARKQFPFILAYSLSIHKIQGATLDCAVVNINASIFEASQAYIALSRVRSRDSLYIQSYKPNKIFCDPEALQFYQDLNQKF